LIGSKTAAREEFATLHWQHKTGSHRRVCWKCASIVSADSSVRRLSDSGRHHFMYQAISSNVVNFNMLFVALYILYSQMLLFNERLMNPPKSIKEIISN
jgi:hypothetical protein